MEAGSDRPCFGSRGQARGDDPSGLAATTDIHLYAVFAPAYLGARINLHFGGFCQCYLQMPLLKFFETVGAIRPNLFGRSCIK